MSAQRSYAEIITEDWKRNGGDSDKGTGYQKGVANSKALVKMKKCRKVKDEDKTSFCAVRWPLFSLENWKITK